MDYGAEELFKPLRSVALAKPTYYDIIRKDTPWQVKHYKNINRNLAMRQHEEMYKALEAEGVKCHFLESVKGATEQKDVRDVGMVTSKGAIVATQRDIDYKRGEAEALKSMCNRLKIPFLNADEEIEFEGGDVFQLDKKNIILGFGKRTRLHSKEVLAGYTGRKNIIIVPHKVSHHLDGAFNFVNKSVIVADERYVRISDELLKERNVISAAGEDSLNMAANFLLLKEDKILADRGCKRFNRVLKEHGVDVVEVDVSELKKNGGSIRCMTQPLLRR